MRTNNVVRTIAFLCVLAIAFIPMFSAEDTSAADSDGIEIQKIGDRSYIFRNTNDLRTVWTFDNGDTALANQSNGYAVVHTFGTSGIKTVRYVIDGNENTVNVPVYDNSFVSTAYTGITYSYCAEGLTGIVENEGYDVPDWLVWDDAQKRLTGTPTVTGTYLIRLWMDGSQTSNLTFKVENGSGMVDPEEREELFTTTINGLKVSVTANSTNVRLNTWHIYNENDISISLWTDTGNSTEYTAASDGRYIVQLKVIMNNGQEKEQIVAIDLQGATEPEAPTTEDIFEKIQDWAENNTNTVIIGAILLVIVLLFISRRI